MKRHTLLKRLQLRDQESGVANWRFLLDGGIWGFLMGVVIGTVIFYLLQYQWAVQKAFEEWIK